MHLDNVAKTWGNPGNEKEPYTRYLTTAVKIPGCQHLGQTPAPRPKEWLNPLSKFEQFGKLVYDMVALAIEGVY